MTYITCPEVMVTTGRLYTVTFWFAVFAHPYPSVTIEVTVSVLPPGVPVPPVSTPVVGLSKNRPTAYMPFGITGKYLFVLQTQGMNIYDIHTLNLVKTIQAPLRSLEHATCANGAYYLAADGIIYRLDSTLSISSCKLSVYGPQSMHQLYAVGDSLFVLPRQGGSNVVSILNGRLKPVGQITITAPGNHRAIERIGDRIWLCTSSGCVALKAADRGHAQVLMPGKSVSKILRDRTVAAG